MAKPSSREELSDYCLRKLGHPVIEINIDDDQVEDRIDEALELYQEYHSDATARMYVKHQITADDIANRYIELPDEWIFVTRLMPFSSTSSATAGMWSAKYQILLQDIYDLHTSGEILSYEMAMQYLNTLDLILNGTPTVRWVRKQNRLYIDANWGIELIEGDYVVVEGRVTLDPEETQKIYNDIWLKRYTTALLKRQWGQNLMKFEGIQMPGGVTLNGRQIFEDGEADVEKYEAELKNDFQLPVDFYTG